MLLSKEGKDIRNMCMDIMLVGRKVWILCWLVGKYVKWDYILKIEDITTNCMLLAIRDLLTILLDIGWQLDLISKNKLFKHLGSQENVSLSNNKRLYNIQMGMSSVWWDIQHIIQHHRFWNIIIWQPTQCV